MSGTEEIDDLPPIDEPEEEIEELPPLDDPEEEIEELPPLDEPEETKETLETEERPNPLIREVREVKVAPVHDPEPEEELPPLDEPEEAEEEPEAEVEILIPVQEEYITGNEVVAPEGKMKKRVKVKLEEDFKAPQMAPQVKDINQDAAYEKNNKAYGDHQYEGEGHGKVLVKQQADDNEAALTNHDYYMQGYTERKKDDFGKERQQNYDYQRAIRKRRMEAPELVKEVEPARPKRQKLGKKKKEKGPKQKKKMNFGTEEYPLRMASKSGKDVGLFDYLIFGVLFVKGYF